jgi:transposase-like protein
MEDSHIPMQKWIMAFHLMCSSKKGISALQLQRELGLGSYRSAWHMAHRIRHAMKDNPSGPSLEGVVEVDETYVGGKPRKGTGPHKRGRGTKKAPVVVLVERDGSARAMPVESVDAKNLKEAIRENVRPESTIHTDELASYAGIGAEFEGGHETVNHSAGEYERNGVHTNTAESYFALLKRGVYGVFHHVSKKHLHRYCDEFSFRWDHRKTTDGERTKAALLKVEGKRLMYSNTLRQHS